MLSPPANERFVFCVTFISQVRDFVQTILYVYQIAASLFN